MFMLVLGPFLPVTKSLSTYLSPSVIISTIFPPSNTVHIFNLSLIGSTESRKNLAGAGFEVPLPKRLKEVHYIRGFTEPSSQAVIRSDIRVPLCNPMDMVELNEATEKTEYREECGSKCNGLNKRKTKITSSGLLNSFSISQVPVACASHRIQVLPF